MLLTIGAGGILTELIRDNVNLLLPCSPEQIESALMSLKIATLLTGYRGRPAVNMNHLINEITKISQFAVANKDQLFELDINPLIAGSETSVALDVLLRMSSK